MSVDDIIYTHSFHTYMHDTCATTLTISWSGMWSMTLFCPPCLAKVKESFVIVTWKCICITGSKDMGGCDSAGSCYHRRLLASTASFLSFPPFTHTALPPSQLLHYRAQFCNTQCTKAYLSSRKQASICTYNSSCYVRRFANTVQAYISYRFATKKENVQWDWSTIEAEC